MSQKLRIKLTIAGRTYPLNIDKDKEERYRRAEKEINSLTTRFEASYRLETVDHLAMAALQIAVTQIEMEMSRNMDSDRDELNRLDKDLDKHLNQLK